MNEVFFSFWYSVFGLLTGFGETAFCRSLTKLAEVCGGHMERA
jgi:hypothetical protein